MSDGSRKPLTLDDLIVSNPGSPGGAPVFRRTHVPIAVLLENPADGPSLDQILDDFPTPGRGDTIAVLELTAKRLSPAKAA